MSRQYDIINDVDELIKHNNWYGLDRYIKYANPRNMTFIETVALVRSTYDVRHKLCYWYDLLKNAREIVQPPYNILSGLE